MSRNANSKHASPSLGSSTEPPSIFVIKRQKEVHRRREMIAAARGGSYRGARPRCTDGLWHLGRLQCMSRCPGRPSVGGRLTAVQFATKESRNTRSLSRRTRWLYSCRVGNQSPFAIRIGIVACSSAGLTGSRTSRAFAHTRKNEAASQLQVSGGSKSCASRNPCAVI